MIISTQGVDKARILFSLYKHAREVTKESRTQYCVRNGLPIPHDNDIGFMVAAYIGRPGVISAEQEIEDTPSLWFGDVDLGDGSVKINVSLLDPNQFDSSAYDGLYGEKAAEQALTNAKLIDLAPQEEPSPLTPTTPTTPISPTTKKWYARQISLGTISPKLNMLFANFKRSNSSSSASFSPVSPAPDSRGRSKSRLSLGYTSS